MPNSHHQAGLFGNNICEGRIRGADLSTDHVPTTRPETFAIYIGGVAASDFYSRAVVLEALRLRINYERELGVRHFLTRPVTNDGLRLARRNHFKPVNSKGQGELIRSMSPNWPVNRDVQTADFATYSSRLLPPMLRTEES